jgi:hypothetical protein
MVFLRSGVICDSVPQMAGKRQAIVGGRRDSSGEAGFAVESAPAEFRLEASMRTLVAPALLLLWTSSAAAQPPLPPAGPLPPAMGERQPLPPPAPPAAITPEPQTKIAPEPPTKLAPARPGAMPRALPPPPAAAAEPYGGRVFCDQNVSFRLTPREMVPEPYRPFVGLFSDAAWTPLLCAALIVESVTPDGTASIIYVYGPMESNMPGKGGVLHGTGIIREGTLRFQNVDGSQFTFRPLYSDLDGRLTTPRGESYGAIFKKTL